MPRDRFHCWDGASLIPDEEGLELPGLDQASARAIRGLTELARDALSEAPGSEAKRI